MADIVISVYFNGSWEILDGVWQFNDVEECKSLIVKEDINYEELVRVISRRFKVDTSAFELRLSHSNTTNLSLKPCDVNSTEDFQSFMFISKLPNVSWSMPICVAAVNKFDARIYGSTREECVNREMDMDGSDYAIGESSGSNKHIPPRIEKYCTNASQLPGQNIDVEHEGLAIESYNRSLASNVVIKKGQCFKSKVDLKTAVCLHEMAQCYEYRVYKSVMDLVVLLCIDDKSKWRLRATKLKNLQMFFISKYIEKHTCGLQMRTSHQRQPSSTL